MIRLNFRESPPTRSQHIRGDARSLQAFRRCWFREASLRELLPARAKWKFVLGHLRPVLGERQPVSFFTLGGAVPSLLNTGISAGAEFFSFGSRRGIWDRHSYFAPFNFQNSKIPIVPSGGGFCTVSAFPTINRLALPGHAAFC